MQQESLTGIIVTQKKERSVLKIMKLLFWKKTTLLVLKNYLDCKKIHKKKFESVESKLVLNLGSFSDVEFGRWNDVT